jgi:hypothetical protein
MAGVRRGATAVMRFFAPLVFIAIVVQIFLAGEGIFGIKRIQELEDAKTLDPHRDLGFILAQPVAILFLIVALLAWHPDRKVRWVSILLPFLTFAQEPLAWAGRWTGGLHPVNAVLLLGLFGWLTHRLWRDARAARVEPAATAAPPTVET